MSDGAYIDRRNAPLVDFVDGRISLNVYISNLVSEDTEELDDALEAWFSDQEVAIAQRFTLSEVLDSALDSHSFASASGVVPEESRLLFDAMRAELLQMVARIDALTFKDSA